MSWKLTVIAMLAFLGFSAPAMAQNENTLVLVPDAPQGAVVAGCFRADRNLYGPHRLTMCPRAQRHLSGHRRRHPLRRPADLARLGPQYRYQPQAPELQSRRGLGGGAGGLPRQQRGARHSRPDLRAQPARGGARPAGGAHAHLHLFPDRARRAAGELHGATNIANTRAGAAGINLPGEEAGGDAVAAGRTSRPPVGPARPAAHRAGARAGAWRWRRGRSRG